MVPNVKSDSRKRNPLTKELKEQVAIFAPDGNMTACHIDHTDWRPGSPEPPGNSKITACDRCHKQKRKCTKPKQYYFGQASACLRCVKSSCKCTYIRKQIPTKRRGTNEPTRDQVLALLSIRTPQQKREKKNTLPKVRETSEQKITDGRISLRRIPDLDLSFEEILIGTPQSDYSMNATRFQ